MASRYRIERDRGTKESRQQLAVLRIKWPLAFPVEDQEVRPLTTALVREVAAAMDWSLAYTHGVIGPWKMAPVYCRAVLDHDRRIALDGSPAEAVDAEAKDLAAKRLAELAARKAGKQPAKAAKEPVKAAKPSGKPAAPAVATPKPAARPAGTPEQLRARVRASLLRPSA